MKNVLILHGTSGSSRGNWFPWLKTELEKRDWKVWVPDLPGADTPNVKLYNEFIFGSDWTFDEESVLIGHSSGSVAILGLLQALPEGKKVKTAVLVGSFKDDLGREDLKGLFEEPFDFDKIKTRAEKFVLIHSDDDPYCPLPGAEYLAEKLGGELIIKNGQKHFSVGTAGERYREFPLILEVVEKL